LFEFLMQGGQIGGLAVKGNYGAKILRRHAGVQNGITFGRQSGNEPSAFAQQLGCDLVDADFEQQFHGAMQAYQPQPISGANLVAAGVWPKDDPLLRDVIRTPNVVPAVNGWVQLFLN